VGPLGLIDQNIFNCVYRNKTVLVTGDTGFKGSWLSIWLHELGARVVGISLPAKTSRDNYVITKLNEKIEHIDGDINDIDQLKRNFKQIQPDFVFHLAAQALVYKSYEDPVETFQTNIMGTINVFEAIRSVTSVKVAIIVTSDKCYKNNEWCWGYRESDPMGGYDPYSASKGCVELVSDAYMHSFFNQSESCKIATVRAGNVIGGGDWAEKRIVPDFFRSIQDNDVLELRNPESTRPWQYVLEPLSGYLNLCSKLYQYGEMYEGGWNFGPQSENNYRVIDLVRKLQRNIGKGDYQIDRGSGKMHEANFLQLDVSKAGRYLEWHALLDFEETIRYTALDYQADFESNDIYAARVRQIARYVEKARSMKLKWADGSVEKEQVPQ